MFFTVSYLNSYVLYFKNPLSSAILGMLLLHDFINYFLLSILFIVVGFFIMSKPYYSLSSIDENELYLLLDLPYDLDTRKRYIKRYVKTYAYNLTHAPTLEFAWTSIPGFILVIIAVPSVILLYTIDQIFCPIYTSVVIGNQWFWSYEYADFNMATIYYNLIRSSYDLINLKKFLTIFENLIISICIEFEYLSKNVWLILPAPKLLPLPQFVKSIFYP
jgi:hypothetical protein